MTLNALSFGYYSISIRVLLPSGEKVLRTALGLTSYMHGLPLIVSWLTLSQN
jgi:hypothetical protein